MIFLLSTAIAAPVDLETAVARAMEAGLDPTSARISTAIAERSLRTRTRAAGPDIRASADVGVGLGYGWSTGTSPFGADAGARVTASLPIYAGGEIRGAIDAAEQDVAAARAAEAQTRQDLVLALAESLLDLESARAAMRTQEEALHAEDALLKRVNARVEVGASTRADALSQAAVVARRRATLVDARRDAAQIELGLEELLRLDDSEFIAPTAAPPDQSAERPDVVLARAQVAAAQAEVRVAGASGRPAVDLDLAASTGWVSGEGPSAFADRANVSGTLGVSVPIWDREVTKGAVETASLQLRAAELALADAERAAATDVLQAKVDVDAAAASVEAARVRVAAATAAAKAVQDRYEAGAALLTELLSARAEQVDAEAAAAQAEVEVVRAAYALAWARGGL